MCLSWLSLNLYDTIFEIIPDFTKLKVAENQCLDDYKSRREFTPECFFLTREGFHSQQYLPISTRLIDCLELVARKGLFMLVSTVNHYWATPVVQSTFKSRGKTDTSTSPAEKHNCIDEQYYL